LPTPFPPLDVLPVPSYSVIPEVSFLYTLNLMLFSATFFCPFILRGQTIVFTSLLILLVNLENQDLLYPDDEGSTLLRCR
jgi:hypothetical protein